MCWRNAKTPNQTLLRPRAHRAVGRWPPASWAGRRVEKNVFPKIAGVKPSYPPKVKESRARQVFVRTNTRWSLAESAVLRAKSGYENHPSPLFRIALGPRRFGRSARLDLQHEKLFRP